MALDAAMIAEMDRASLDKLCQELESKHLVFSLRTPQVHNVEGADTVVILSRSLKVVSDDLDALIDAAEGIGNPNVARMRELNGDVVTLTANAGARVDGVSDALLRLVPADWLANRQVLVPFQEKNRLSRADLGKAREHIAEIRRLLDWTPPAVPQSTRTPRSTST